MVGRGGGTELSPRSQSTVGEKGSRRLWKQGLVPGARPPGVTRSGAGPGQRGWRSVFCVSGSLNNHQVDGEAGLANNSVGGGPFPALCLGLQGPCTGGGDPGGSGSREHPRPRSGW